MSNGRRCGKLEADFPLKRSEWRTIAKENVENVDLKYLGQGVGSSGARSEKGKQDVEMEICLASIKVPI